MASELNFEIRQQSEGVGGRLRIRLHSCPAVYLAKDGAVQARRPDPLSTLDRQEQSYVVEGCGSGRAYGFSVRACLPSGSSEFSALVSAALPAKAASLCSTAPRRCRTWCARRGWSAWWRRSWRFPRRPWRARPRAGSCLMRAATCGSGSWTDKNMDPYIVLEIRFGVDTCSIFMHFQAFFMSFASKRAVEGPQAEPGACAGRGRACS